MKAALRRISGIVLAVPVAVLLLALFFAISPSDSVDAQTFEYTTTRKYCNALTATFVDPSLAGNPACTNPVPATGAPRTVTTDLVFTTGHLNFNNYITYEPNAAGFTPGCNIDTIGGDGIADDREFSDGSFSSSDGIDNDFDGDIDGADSDNECLEPGDKVGGSRNETTLGFVNQSCGPALGTTVDFVFYNVELPNDPSNPRASTNIHVPDPEGTANRFLNSVNDANTDDIADPDSPIIVDYPDWLLDLFDSDWEAEVPAQDGPFNSGTAADPRQNSSDGPEKPLMPIAVYGGAASVSGTWTTLFFVQFEDGVLSEDDNPGPGFDAPHPFNSALATVGQPSQTILTDTSEAEEFVNTVTDFCTPLVSHTLILGTSVDNSQIVAINPTTAGSHPSWTEAQSIRDLDQDGLENNFDTCPTIANMEDPRATAGAGDSDMIDPACDPTPGTNTGGGDHDGDSFQNAQDNCPLVSNAGQEQAELTNSYTASAPDGGPETDGIGDACDGTTGGVPEVDTEVGNVPPCNAGNPAVSQNGVPICIQLSDSVANGQYLAKGYHLATCYGGGSDVDGDGWCAADDPDDSSGSGANRHPSYSDYVTGGDVDGDGFDVFIETHLGTDATKDCRLGSGNTFDAWPTDFNDDTATDIFDVNILKPSFFLNANQGGYVGEADLNADTQVDIFDVNILKPVFFVSCTETSQQ